MNGSPRRTTPEGQPLYKLRFNGNNGYSLAVPREIAQMIPRDSLFAFKLTDDGFAYSLVKTFSEDGLPEWLTQIASSEQ